MKEKIIDSMCDFNLSPLDFLPLMFERTDEDGTLYIPGWHYDVPGYMYNQDEADEYSYRCKLNWDYAKYEKILKKFTQHLEMINEIAAALPEMDQEDDTAKKELSPELFAFWKAYIRGFDEGEYDYEKMCDIDDRLETIEWVKYIASNVAKGDAVEKFEKDALSEYIDVSVSKEEREYRDNFTKYIYKQAEERIGKNICAYDVVIRSRRLCRLIQLKAPQIIVYNEGRQLAAAFVLHECGISREPVDNNIRLRLERLETMSDEELDEFYRPKKTNSRKSLAPLFVYEIITRKSDSRNHLRQNDILKELGKYPYEITLERKALSRIIHNLADSGYDIYSDNTGVWKEKQ